MPAKNVIKDYVAGGYYHVYNRGVEKRRIFLDHRDYRMFLHLIQRHLDPSYQPGRNERTPRDLTKSVQLNAYCLMPNHIHLLLHQLSQRGIEEFGRSVYTAYSMYFNWRYDRVGSLFQGCYKAVHIESSELLTHEVNYIHNNPLELGVEPGQYPYSSWGAYHGASYAAWLTPLQGEFLTQEEFLRSELHGQSEANLLTGYKH